MLGVGCEDAFLDVREAGRYMGRFVGRWALDQA